MTSCLCNGCATLGSADWKGVAEFLEDLRVRNWDALTRERNGKGFEKSKPICRFRIQCG